MISVIIATYNEGNLIAKALLSLNKQSLGDFEVIVVDDGSKNSPESEIKNLKNLKFKLTFLTQKHTGVGAARNLGAKKAVGEVLVFVDADMVFEKHFLKNLIKPIGKNGVIGTFSKMEYVSNWNNALSRCWSINEGWEEKRRHPKNYPDTQKVYRAILKKEFDRVGGFTTGGYTDDYSLFTKIQILAVNAPNAIFYHENPETFKEIYVHAKWTAKRDYKFGKLGAFLALFRATLPFSLIIGLIKSVIKKEPLFILFKITYDFGVVIGIIEKYLWKKSAK